MHSKAVIPCTIPTGVRLPFPVTAVAANGVQLQNIGVTGWGQMFVQVLPNNDEIYSE